MFIVRGAEKKKEKRQSSASRTRAKNPKTPASLIHIHLRRTLILLRSRRSLWGRRRLRFRGLRARTRRNHRLGLGLGQNRDGEINQLIPLLLNLCTRQDGIDVLRSLALPHVLVLEPLLDRRHLLNDGLLVLGVDVRVLLVSGGGLGHVVVERLAEVRDGLLALVDLLVAEGDRVAHDFEDIETGDVGGLGRLLAFFGV